MACTLTKNANGLGYTTESINALQTFIFDTINTAIDNSDGGENTKLLKSNLKKALYKIGDTYHNRYLNEIVELIKIAVEDSWDGLQDFFPEAGLRNTISKENRKIFNEDSTQEQYLQDTLEEEEDSIGFIKSQFLDDAFGNRAKLKNDLKQKVTHKLLSTFIIDRENGKIVSNISEANNNVRAFKQELLDIMIANLKKHPELCPEISNLPENTNLFENNIYTNLLEKSEMRMITRHLDDIEYTKLQSWADNNPEIYEAYTAWFTLNNFDNFIDLILGNAIIVKPEAKNRLSDGNNYTFSTKSDNLITSWRSDDNIILEHEIGALAQSLINSTPFYKKGIDNKTGKFIKFEDFYRIVTKIKDLVLDPNTSSFIFNKRNETYKILSKYALNDYEKKLIENKSLSYVINNIRTNPQEYLKLTMKILNLGDVMKTLGFTEEELDKCYSIYKGFFDGSESIYEILSKDEYDHNTENYYELITLVADSLFSVNFLQYYEDRGIVSVRTLKDLSVDNVRRRLENNIIGSNSRKILETNFELNEMDPYEAEIIKDENTNQIQGIHLTITDNDPMLLDKFVLNVELTGLGDVITFRDESGKVLPIEDVANSIGNAEILKFIDNLLHLDLSHDKELLDNIILVAGGSKNNYVPAFQELMDLATTVLFNKYLSNVDMANLSGYNAITKRLNGIYGSTNPNIPTFNTLLNEINLIPNNKLPKLEHIASAVTILTGEAQSAQVRDADGNMLSSQTLSRLLGNIMSQHEQIRSTDNRDNLNIELLKHSEKFKNLPFKISFNDASSKPIIVNGNELFVSEYLLRKDYENRIWNKSYVQSDGSRTKELPEKIFKSFEEFLTFTLEKEFLRTLRAKKDTETEGVYEDILNSKTITAMNFGNAATDFSLLKPGVYKGVYTTKEFKSQLGNKLHTQFTVAESIQGNFLYDFIGGFQDVDNKSGKKLIGNGIIGLLPSVNSDKNTIGRALFNLREQCRVDGITSIKLNDRYKTFAELTDDELLEVIAKEFANSYNTSYQNIIKDYKTLQNWLLDIKEISLDINPENDFKELNQYCDKVGIPAPKQLYIWSNEYNNSHAHILKFTDQVHFMKDDNHIKYNNTSRSLLERYSDPKRLKQFMQLKFSELLKSLIEENVEINLINDLVTTTATPKSWLLTTYPDWVHKIDTNISGQPINQVRNGRMVLAKVTYDGNIYSITQRKDLKQLSDLSGIDLMQNPHELVRSDLFKLELHPMLRKYNMFDYLFSLEFMIAGVGSHIAHPFKKSLKTPIMWVHPAMGKTYTIENSSYKNQIMDWDVEFNRIRDTWISQTTNTIIGTPEYKAVRNEYLINWRNHKDFKEFVENKWKEIKHRAVNQNKILIASPTMLLELFPNDFNKIITMSSEEFIKRGTAREDSNPAAWKESIDKVLANVPLNIPKITANSNEYLLNMLEHGNLNKELYQLEDNEMLEEAARFLAQHKRNVSYTAAMHEFLLGLITGIPTTYNMAVMDDIKADVYTNSGDNGEQGATPFDGATFVNPWVVIWENNSLKGDKAGIDKKQFVHYYDAATGTGGIIKTAGFGVTNDRIRRYKFYRDMIYNMTNRKWTNADGSVHTVKDGGILVDFNDKAVNYGSFYFKDKGHYYMREISEYLGNNKYKVVDTEVDITGDPMSDSVEHELAFDVDSNYRVWLMFGGYNSMELNERGELQPSEKSIQLTSQACNNYGTILSKDKPKTADDVYQPMKHSDIHYMPTIGAIKEGAGNVNPGANFFGKHQLNFMLVEMRLAGIQLDKEHHADNAELSMMTLVISAACAKGYRPEAAKKLYDSLYKLTQIGTKEFRDELGLIVGNETLFDNAISNIIMKSMLNSTSSDGDIMLAIAKDILFEMKHKKELEIDDKFFKKVDETIPYSDASIFNKVVSALTVAMTKSGIKTKIPGVLSVLCPAHEIVKFYKVPALDANGNQIIDANGNPRYKRVTFEKLEDMYPEYDFNEHADELLLQLHKKELPLQINQVNIGYRYIIKYTNGTLEIAHITMPNYIGKLKIGFNLPNGTHAVTGFRDVMGKTVTTSRMGYRTLKEMVNKGLIESIKEWNVDGLDLNSYNVRFSDGTNTYQLADLDIVLDYFDVKDSDGSEQYKLLFNLLHKYGKTEEFFDRMFTDINRVWGDKTTQSKKKEFLYTTLEHIKEAPQVLIDLNNLKNKSEMEKELLNFIKVFGLKFMNRLLQITLNGVSKNSNMNIVKVNGKDITIDKESIDITSYGVIMPKTFKSNFGLNQFDDLEDIKNDIDFFTKRLIKNFGTHVEIYEDENGDIVNNFHIELKRADGKHIYLRLGLDHSDLTKEVQWFKRIDSDGKVYRINSKNQVICLMYSEVDKIYQDIDGNEIIVTSADKVIYEDENGNEIDVHDKSKARLNNKGRYVDIKTGKEITRRTVSGLLFYLDNLDYSSVNISRGCLDTEFNDMLNKIEISTNKNAQSVAKIIQKFGGDDFDKLRLISDLLNNYDAILNSNPADAEQLEIKTWAMKHIERVGRLMHTSFLETLKIIAARIPAQNQQSFMPMEVQAYDNPDINTAYVSIFQFYLLGSDLDIDAVSLQTFEVDRNGLFVGHSPYFNLDNTQMKKESEKIPFPTGKNITPSEVNTSSETFIEKHLLLFGASEDALFLVIFKKKDNKVFVRLNTNTPENIHKLIDVINSINKNGYNITTEDLNLLVANALNSVVNIKKRQITAENIETINSFIISAINKHNQYINKALPKKRELILKNYITTLLFDIISDPINLMEAQSSVDVVTDPAKDLAKSSPKATVQHTFTPGNVANKFLSISENMVGKDGIAICATGLKSFFALTELYQLIMNGTDVSEKEKLLFNVTIGGKTYKGLANGFALDYMSGYEKVLDPEELEIQNQLYSQIILDYLIDQLWASDAANDMSALLGLSVDNAKELILAKMNAGTASIGMYLYGLSIGMSFDDLYKIMTSPLAFRLTELTKGDYFNGNAGTFSVMRALNYLRLEPDILLRHNNIDLSQYQNVELPGTYILNKIKAKADPDSQSPILDLIRACALVDKTALEKLKTFIADFRNDLDNIKRNIKDNTVYNRYEAMYNQAIDELLQYIDDAGLTYFDTYYSNIYGGGNLFSDLEKLAMGGDELKLLGKILKLNKQINTNPADLINLVNNIEEAIIRRISSIRAYNRRHNISKTNYANIDSELSAIVYNNNYKEPLSNGGYRIDLNEFILNPSYRLKAIDLYDQLKVSYNPLKVIANVPHYKGYMESLNNAYKGLNRKSVKFKFLSSRVKAFTLKYNVVDPKLLENVIKNAENAVSLAMRLSWMSKTFGRKLITIPASTDTNKTYAFIDTTTKARPVYYPREIQLGTELGDANFKLWMETSVIPDLKSKYHDNEFIRNIAPIISSRTNLGTIAVNYSLPINMMPRTDYEKDIFNQNKEAFNALISKDAYKDGAGKKWSLKDLFYIYSLICNNGKMGPRSLHSIFEDSIDDKLPRSYRAHIAKLDKNKTYYTDLVKLISDEELAPFGSPYRGGSDILRYIDNTYGKVKLMTKKVQDYGNDYYEEDFMMETTGYDPYEDYENYGDSEPTEIANYVIDSTLVSNNSVNYNYFLNPKHIDGLVSSETIALSIPELEMFPELNKVTINFNTIKNQSEFLPILLEIKAKNDEDSRVVEKFINYITKEKKGILPTFIMDDEETGEKVNIINKSAINDILSSIKYCNL